MRKAMKSKEHLMTRQEGTRDCREPEDTSKRTEDQKNGTETTKREVLEIMDWTEGQEDCRAGRVEQSKSGAERWRVKAKAEKTETWKTGAESGLEGQERAQLLCS